MRMRFLGTLLLLACSSGCLRSLDGNKVPCSTSDHCPSHYTCQEGFCKPGRGSDSGASSDARASSDGSGADKKDAILLTGPDAASSSVSPDAPLPATGGAGGVGTAPGASGTTGGTGIVGSGGQSSSGSTGAAGTSVSGGATSTDGGVSGGVVTTSGSAGTGGASGSGGSTALGGSASGGTLATSSSSTLAAGSTGSGGKGGAPGGATSSSSTSTSPGGASTAGAGGTSTTSSATCQPKPRDCTSTQDNNCNGIPDNQETTSCACPVGQKRDCQEHPGQDGKGICKKGSQTCTASSDKTTSSWTECSGAVGPSTEVCDAAGVDENCDGQSNEGCECVNGTSIPCECGPATTCTNGKKGTCSVSKITMYKDLDADNFGNRSQPAMVCPGTPVYSSNGDDCDDGDISFKPGVSMCSSDATQKISCTLGAGGVPSTEPCDHGCLGRTCRPASDGTIGLPGYVSCDVKKCPASQGCSWGSETCGTTESPGLVHCDGPNDCPGAQCCVYYGRGGVYSQCETGTCPTSYYPACDPQANTTGCSCNLLVSNFPIYACM